MDRRTRRESLDESYAARNGVSFKAVKNRFYELNEDQAFINE
jgi:hypothetical protein